MNSKYKLSWIVSLITKLKINYKKYITNFVIEYKLKRL